MAVQSFSSLEVPDLPEGYSASVKSGERVGLEHLLIPSDEYPKFDGKYLHDYVKENGGVFEENLEWANERASAEGAHLVPLADQLQNNLKLLAKALNELHTGVFSESTMKLNSGIRPPKHNNAIGGVFASRHQSGLAADIRVVTKSGDEMSPRDVAKKVETHSSYFLRAIYYSGFVHVALPRSSRRNDDDKPVGRLGFELMRDTKNGAQLVNSTGTVPPTDAETGEGDPVEDFGAPARAEVDPTAATGNNSDDLLSQLGVRSEKHEQVGLADKAPPETGEMDIGDLRFGSVRFDEDDPSDLNQPTSIVKQNAGSAAGVPMLRTDMNPIITETKTFPEVSVTISMNATRRDDVNRRLRPLVAMHRRMPFCAVRNEDMARMMLGLTDSSDPGDVLAKRYPDLDEEKREELRNTILQEGISSVWIPVTFQQVAVDTQPGVSGMFEAHIVLKLANIMPYVPRLMWWRDTQSAIEWAQYISLRSTQSADPLSPKKDRMAGERNVMLPSGKAMKAQLPKKDGEPGMAELQSSSPHQSYVFKKFYRGLLEEYQPEVAVKSGDEDESDDEDGNASFNDVYVSGGDVPPLGQTENGSPVYEPAYPISDYERRFETYDATSPIGLEYVAIGASNNPQARFGRVISSIEERANLGQRLDEAATVKDFIGRQDDGTGFEEVGKPSPFLIGPGRQWGKIMLSMRQTTSQLSDAVSKVGSEIVNAARSHDLSQEVTDYGFNPEGGVTTRTQRLTASDIQADLQPGEDAVVDAVLAPGEGFGQEGVLDFQVPSGKFEDVFVNFGEDYLPKLQKSLLGSYVTLIRRMGCAEEWNTDRWESEMPNQAQKFNAPGSEEAAYDWSPWFDFFLGQKIVEYNQGNRPDVSTESPTSYSPVYGEVRGWVSYKGGISEWMPEGFGSYMLTYDFLQDLLEETEDWPDPENAYENGFPKAAAVARAELAALFESVQDLQGLTAEAVSNSEPQIRRALSNQAEETTGYLALQNATVENVHLRFENKFGEKEWEAYPEPVSQHLGGDNAHVTIELTTNSDLLLDQLGELRRSQESVSQRRDTSDVVPPLLRVLNPGNILRAHGIRQLAYRSHTEHMADKKPGYYKVRLELVQDEETALRTEKLRQIGKPTNSEQTIRATQPLTLPVYEGPGVEEQRPAAAYDLLGDLYPDLGLDAEPRSGVGGRQPSPLYPREAYEIEDENTPSLYQVLENRRVRQVDVSFEPATQRGPDDPAFSGEVTWTDKNGVRQEIVVDFSPYLSGLTEFLDYAAEDDEVNTATYQRLVQRVESSLSTTGYRRGLILSWINIAEAQLLQQTTENRDAPRGSDDGGGLSYQGKGIGRSFGNTTQETSPEPRDPVVADNLTKLITALSAGQEGKKTEVASFHRPKYALAASELTSIVADNPAVYSSYHEWLTENARDTKAVEWARQETVDQQTAMPSAYTDLLMPGVEDPEQDGMNILGWDFPFGPGQDKLGEDKQFQNYEIASQMREVATLRMATAGFEVMRSYVQDEENADRIKGAFKEAMNNLAQQRDGNLIEDSTLPIDQPNEFEKLLEEANKNKAFRTDAEVGGGVPASDLVEAFKISKIFEYLSQVIEASIRSSDADISSGDKLNNQIANHVKSVLQSVDSGRGLAVGSGDVADAAQLYQNASDVKTSDYLKSKREELIRTLTADEGAIRKHLGFNDRHSNDERASLRRKANERWKDWIGMRRAFPSYLMMLSGRVGTGLYEAMGQQYSWTALQQMEIREMAGNAGDECDLTISNMRKQLTGGNQPAYDLVGRGGFDDQTLPLTNGTHLHVYHGYGPDARHMKPFTGRVTSVNHGAVTQVVAKSYSATLNQPPSDGTGFYVDGWDGEQSIAEAILYTVSQTDGLEGLGRLAPGSARDRLGRTTRGVAEDDYRSSVMIDIYESMGKPGSDWLLQNSGQLKKSGKLIDVIAEYGLNNAKELLLGDPAIYENIYVTADPKEPDAVNTLFASVTDYISGGKGWGWASMPGTTAWATLKEQSKLFPDYVVTTRPYNEGVPVHRMQKHPLRQTLYFGPKTGGYVKSSRKPTGTTTFGQIEKDEIDSILESLDKEGAVDLSGRGVGDGVKNARLWSLYEDLFVERTILRSLAQIIQGGGELSVSDSIWDSFDEIKVGTPFVADWSTAVSSEYFSEIGSVELNSTNMTRLGNRVRETFPETWQLLARNMEVGGTRINDVVAGNRDGMLPASIIQMASVWPGDGEVPKASLPATQMDMYSFVGSVRGTNDPSDLDDILNEDYERPIGAADVDGEAARRAMRVVILDRFRQDLRRLAKRAKTAGNVVDVEFDSNPVVKRIREKMIENGYVPGERTRDIQQHHFGDVYRHLASNQMSATSDHPGFANKLTVTFPSEPDERMTAFLGQEGSLNSYQVQASPTINRQDIVHEQVPFRNLRLRHSDASGLLGDQVNQVLGDNGAGIESLIKERTAIRDLPDGTKTYSFTDGNGIREAIKKMVRDSEEMDMPEDFGAVAKDRALKLVTQTIHWTLSELEPFYVRPKYSTAAINMLRDRMRNMYSGSLEMAGNPQVKPYHIIHMWDDVNQMHGPVEVEGVYHRFNTEEGYCTQINPKLVTYIRGADEAMDTEWMAQTARLSNSLGWWNRASSLMGTMFDFGAKASGYYTAAYGLNWLAGGLGLSIAGGGSALLAGGGVIAAVFGALAGWELAEASASYLREGGERMAKRHLGLVTGAMDANPMTLLPVTHKGKAYTAGLTGATGPASMTSVQDRLFDADEGIINSNQPASQVFQKLRGLYDPTEQTAGDL